MTVRAPAREAQRLFPVINCPTVAEPDLSNSGFFCEMFGLTSIRNRDSFSECVEMKV